MRIGLIADTHGLLKQKALDVFEGCDAIIHAGDIGKTSVLIALENIAPVTAVYGNCDYSDYGPGVVEVAEPIFDGVRFKVVHRPQDVGYVEPDVSVVVHGHTHLTRDEMVDGVRYLNPGSASNPHGGLEPTVAIVTVENGMVKDVEFAELT